MAIDLDQIGKVTKTRLLRARNTWEAWSGWWWAPPEYLVTVEIARGIRAVGDVKWVTLEHNVRDTLRRAGGGMGRPADSLPKQGRFDIVVWSERKPRGVIEVKTGACARLADDVQRVCDAIRNAPEIRWGLVAFIYSWGDGSGKPGAARVRDRVASLAEDAAKITCAEKMKLVRHHGRVQVRAGGSWTAEVFQISRSRKRA